MTDDERLLAELGAALDEGPAEPPPERVLALRRQVAASAGADQAGSQRRPEATRLTRLRWVPAFLLGAAAAAAVAVGIVVSADDGPSVPREPVDVEVAVTGVGAEADLIAHTWGIEIELVVEGLDEGQRYVVTVEDVRGQQVPAGTFVGVADRPVDCRLNAAVVREDVRSFQVATGDGARVLTAEVA